VIFIYYSEEDFRSLLKFRARRRIALSEEIGYKREKKVLKRHEMGRAEWGISLNEAMRDVITQAF
jgi:hypothetical protein